MPRVKSAKGRVIDFDLLKIKRQIADKPLSIDVKARQAFIDQKARRRLRKITKQATAAVDVNSELLAGVEPSQANPMIEIKQAPPPQVVDVSTTVEDKSIKQKVRPPKE